MGHHARFFQCWRPSLGPCVAKQVLFQLSCIPSLFSLLLFVFLEIRSCCVAQAGHFYLFPECTTCLANLLCVSRLSQVFCDSVGKPAGTELLRGKEERHSFLLCLLFCPKSDWGIQRCGNNSHCPANFPDQTDLYPWQN